MQRQSDDTYQTFKGRMVDQVAQRRLTGAAAESEKALAEIQESAKRERLEGGETLEAYAQTVMDRLLASYPNRPAARIQISAGTTYQAKALPPDIINLSQTALINADSEDELAGILGHEVSHLLLNHHAKDPARERWKSLRAQAYGGALTLNEMAGGKGRSAGSRQDVSTWLIASMAVVETVDEVILSPAWTRTQEDEADLLGLDLVVKAGYNPDAALTVLQRVRAQEQKSDEETRKAQEAHDRMAGDKIAQGDLNGGMDLMIKELTNLPLRAFADFKVQAGREHSAGNLREDLLIRYMEREYADLPARQDFETARYQAAVFSGSGLFALRRQLALTRGEQMLKDGKPAEAEALGRAALKTPQDTDPPIRQLIAKAALAQGNRIEAIRHLEFARRDGRAGTEVFDLLIMLYRTEKKPDLALTVLRDMIARNPAMGEDSQWLQITLLVEAGRRGQAAQMLDQCRRSKRPDIVQHCIEAAGAA